MFSKKNCVLLPFKLNVAATFDEVVSCWDLDIAELTVLNADGVQKLRTATVTEISVIGSTNCPEFRFDMTVQSGDASSVVQIIWNRQNIYETTLPKIASNIFETKDLLVNWNCFENIFSKFIWARRLESKFWPWRFTVVSGNSWIITRPCVTRVYMIGSQFEVTFLLSYHDPQCFGSVDSKLVCENHFYSKSQCELYKCCFYDDQERECKGDPAAWDCTRVDGIWIFILYFTIIFRFSWIYFATRYCYRG